MACRKVMHTEMDAKYCDLFGLALLKSFSVYNPGWELYVTDLGLTDAQREELRPHAKVVRRKKTAHGRWPMYFARMESMVDILSYADMVCHFDGDVLVFTSMEPVFEEMEKQAAELALVPRMDYLRRTIYNKERLSDIFPDANFESWKDQPEICDGIYFLFNTAAVRELFKEILEKFELIGIFAYGCQTWISAAIYERKVKFMPLPSLYDYNLDFGGIGNRNRIIPSMRPVSKNFELLPLLHFTHAKYKLLNTSGPLSNTWRGWSKIVERFKQLPWPNQTIQE